MHEYRKMLKKFNNMQEDVQKKCTDQRKQIGVVKKMTKQFVNSEEEKREHLKETKRCHGESKNWKSFFPALEPIFFAFSLVT